MAVVVQMRDVSARYHGGPETILVSEGWRLDQEFSYFGGREGALRFLDDYDCWEGVSIDPDTSVSVEKGRLEVVHREPPINDSVDDLPTDPFENVEVVYCMTSHVEVEEADR